jgi:membrane protease YdiL (CAAX protease family)
MTDQPSWGWKEVVIAVSLLIPAMLIGSLLAIGIAGFILGQTPSQVQVAIPGQIIAYSLWLAAVWILLRTPTTNFWQSVKWNWPDGGPWIYLALGPGLALATGLIASLLHAKNIQNGLMEQLLADPVGCRLLVLFGITGAPLIEELLFRGIILPVAIRSLGTAAGLLVTSIPFSVMHGPMYDWSWQHLFLLVLVGVAFGMVRIRSNSTLASTVTHGAYNLMMFAAHFLNPQ